MYKEHIYCWAFSFVVYIAYRASTAETFPSIFALLLRLTQLFHLASGVDPLILAWQRGKDTDGTLLVNLICKSKMSLCFPSVFSRLPLSHLDLSISPSRQAPDRFTAYKCECVFSALPHWGLLWNQNFFWCSDSLFSVCMLKKKKPSLND